MQGTISLPFRLMTFGLLGVGDTEKALVLVFALTTVNLHRFQ